MNWNCTIHVGRGYGRKVFETKQLTEGREFFIPEHPLIIGRKKFCRFKRHFGNLSCQVVELITTKCSRTSSSRPRYLRNHNDKLINSLLIRALKYFYQLLFIFKNLHSKLCIFINVQKNSTNIQLLQLMIQEIYGLQ